MVKQWCLRVGNLVFVKGTHELDRKVVMKEINCVRVMTESGAVFTPVENIKALENLKSAVIAMFGGAGMPAWNDELSKALDTLRVYATNTINKTEK